MITWPIIARQIFKTVYSDRIQNYEILVVFLFHAEASQCIAELVWAINAGKKVIILTTQEIGSLPPMLQGEALSNYSVLNKFTSFEEAVESFKQDLDNQFNEQIEYYEKLTHEEKEEEE